MIVAQRPYEAYFTGFLLVASVLFAITVLSGKTPTSSPSPTGATSFEIAALQDNCSNINETTNLTANVNATFLSATTIPCFNITADNITLDCRGFTIFGAGLGVAIRFDNVTLLGGPRGRSGVVVQNCIIENFTTGFELGRVNHSLVFNNTVRNTTEAIVLGQIFNVTLNNNSIQNVIEAVDDQSGSLSADVINLTFDNNTILNTRGGSYTFFIDDTGNTGSDLRVRNNIFSNITTSSTNEMASISTHNADIRNNYLININTTVVFRLDPSNDRFRNSIFHNNTILNASGIGVRCNGAHNTIMSNNILINVSDIGFRCFRQDNATFENNTVSRMQGLAFSLASTSFSESRNVTFVNNTIANTTSTGLNVTFNNSRVLFNFIENNTGAGMNVENSPNNGFFFTQFSIIAGNTIRNNTGTGMMVAGRNNTIENNTVTDNGPVGIDFGTAEQTSITSRSPFNLTLRNNTVLLHEIGLIIRYPAARARGNHIEANNLSGNTNGSMTVFTEVAATSTLQFNITTNNSVFPANLTFIVNTTAAESQRITFLNTTSVSARRDFGAIIKVNSTAVRVNASLEAGFNSSARIILAGNTLNVPGIQFDAESDGTASACASTQCTDAQAVSGYARFTVTHFSTYIINETVPLNLTALSDVINTTFLGAINQTNISGQLNTTGDGLGYSMATCDINRDNVTDFVFGAPFVLTGNHSGVGENISDAGMVYAVYGIPTMPSTFNITNQSNVTIEGINVTGLLGRAVTCGDFNNDGFEDIAGGAPGANQSVIVFGNNVATRSFLQNETNVSINITGVDDLSMTIGDFNNDSIEDLVIGQPDFNNFAGRVSVIFGRSSWPRRLNISDNVNVTISDGAGDYFGFSLAGGDFNNDGFDDLAVGAPGRNISSVHRVGTVFVFYGPLTASTLSSANANLSLNGTHVIGGENNTNSMTGFSLYGRGDVNNDGIDDLLVGSPNGRIEDNGLVKRDAGVTYLLFGRTGLSGHFSLNSSANVTFYGVFGMPSATNLSSAGERSGFAVFAKNVTANDTIEDVLIGAPLAGTSDAGYVYVVSGRTVWPRFFNLTGANFTIEGSKTSGLLGFAFANASEIKSAPSQSTTGTISLAVEGGGGEATLVGVSFDSSVVSGNAGDAYRDEALSAPAPAAEEETPAATGGGGGGGGPSYVGGTCRDNTEGEPGMWVTTNNLNQWYDCNDPMLLQLTTGDSYISQNLADDYAECCPAITPAVEVTATTACVEIECTKYPRGVNVGGLLGKAFQIIPCESQVWQDICAKALGIGPLTAVYASLCAKHKKCCACATSIPLGPADIEQIGPSK